MEVYRGISGEKLESILNSIKKCNIALIGDVCLDVYWHADMKRSELSRETPHFPLPIVKERMYPGGGGNAAANVAALKPNSIKVLGVTGRDWRGDMLIRTLKETGVNTEGVVISEKAVTNAYCKPIRKGISDVEYEDPRLDFCNYEKLSREDEALLLEQLMKCAGYIDVLCVSDQLQFGCITDVVREKIIHLAKEGLKVIVDSRDRIGLYSGVTLKPNELEGTRALNKDAVTAGMYRGLYQYGKGPVRPK
jgi:bifunctional ADP-heptose synthase (sugar kinase/adenylyltransferase)